MASKLIVLSALLAAASCVPQAQYGYGAASARYAQAPEPYDAHPKYTFAFQDEDPHTGEYRLQHETRDGDRVEGEYSLVEPDRIKRTVQYSADDHNGFNPKVKWQRATGYAAPAAYTVPKRYALMTYAAPATYAAPFYAVRANDIPTTTRAPYAFTYSLFGPPNGITTTTRAPYTSTHTYFPFQNSITTTTHAPHRAPVSDSAPAKQKPNAKPAANARPSYSPPAKPKPNAKPTPSANPAYFGPAYPRPYAAPAAYAPPFYSAPAYPKSYAAAATYAAPF